MIRLYFLFGCRLLELENPEVTAEVKKQLAGVKKSLKKMTFKGSHILLQKLEDTD